VRVFLAQRSKRRTAVKQLADARRRTVAQNHNVRREVRPEAVTTDHRAVGFGGRGRVAGRLACVYFTVTMLVIVSAIPETSGDTLTVGLAILTTLPLSLGVLAFPDDSAWTLVTLAACALINAFVFWIAVRSDSA
jgi:hypothetical protein